MQVPPFPPPFDDPFFVFLFGTLTEVEEELTRRIAIILRRASLFHDSTVLEVLDFQEIK